MIFVIGGFVILIISFVVALVSLIKEQRNQHEVAQNNVQPDPDIALEPVESAPEDKPIAEVETPQKSEEEIKSQSREEAYKILQSRVAKMTESEAAGIPFDEPEEEKVPEPKADIEPETNIEDPIEADLAVAESVPFPWEDKSAEGVKPDETAPPVDIIETPAPVPAPVVDKANVWKPEFTNNLTGNINLDDLKKDEE